MNGRPLRALSDPSLANGRTLGWANRVGDQVDLLISLPRKVTRNVVRVKVVVEGAR